MSRAESGTATARPVVAVTGATGFIGRRLIPLLAAAGWQPRILVRRDPADLNWGGLEIDLVSGNLSDPASLGTLVAGAQAVIHLAGLIKAARRQDFFTANRDGSRALAEAVRDHASGAHLLLVSSLAAREAQLSDYAASKRAGEDVAREVYAQNLSILRPPAVYGPGDVETLVFFQLAALPRIPLLGSKSARTAVIHVDDLCRAIVALLAAGPTSATHSVTDERPDGYSWQEIMAAAAAAQDFDNARYFQLPGLLLKTAAAVGDLGAALGHSKMLTSAKLRELWHPDWSVPPQERLPLAGSWSPRYDLATGFRDAVAAYRVAGWLKKPA